MKTGRKGEGITLQSLVLTGMRGAALLYCFSLFLQSTALYVHITLGQKISQEPHHSSEV
jgi:hypothetical protein